jgi:hypothetical protein
MLIEELEKIVESIQEYDFKKVTVNLYHAQPIEFDKEQIKILTAYNGVFMVGYHNAIQFVPISSIHDIVIYLE